MGCTDWTLFPFLYFARPLKEAERTAWLCSTSKKSALKTAYNVMGFAFLYLVPLIAIVILNSWIIKSLRKINPMIHGNSQSNITRNKRNQRTMKMLVLIIVFFFVCWTPYYSSVFLKQFENVCPRNSTHCLQLHLSIFQYPCQSRYNFYV